MDTIEIICTVIGAIGVILGGVWFIIVRVTKSGIKEYRLSKVEEKLSSLPCNEHGASLEVHGNNIGRIDVMLKENNNMLVELSKWAMRLDESMIENSVKKSSPLKMTNAGAYLFAKSGADKVLERL